MTIAGGVINRPDWGSFHTRGDNVVSIYGIFTDSSCPLIGQRSSAKRLYPKPFCIFFVSLIWGMLGIYIQGEIDHFDVPESRLHACLILPYSMCIHHWTLHYDCHSFLLTIYSSFRAVAGQKLALKLQKRVRLR